MIFVNLKHENVVQERDRLRLDARDCFSSPDPQELQGIEVRAEAGGDFFDITSDGFLDWSYTTSGEKVVTVRCSDGDTDFDRDFTLMVISEEDDMLYSDDQKLKVHEPDILKWIQEGRNSYKDVHRRIQTLILDDLDRAGYVDDFGNKITKEHLIDKEEVTEWATFWALKLIFEGLSNATDDIFHDKALRYKALRDRAKKRAVLRLDLNLDGKLDKGEHLPSFSSAGVVRR